MESQSPHVPHVSTDTHTSTAAASSVSAKPDYRAMIRADVETLIDKYATLALTKPGINPRWIMALRMVELFLG